MNCARQSSRFLIKNSIRKLWTCPHFICSFLSRCIQDELAKSPWSNPNSVEQKRESVLSSWLLSSVGALMCCRSLRGSFCSRKTCRGDRSVYAQCSATATAAGEIALAAKFNTTVRTTRTELLQQMTEYFCNSPVREERLALICVRWISHCNRFVWFVAENCEKESCQIVLRTIFFVRFRWVWFICHIFLLWNNIHFFL